LLILLILSSGLIYAQAFGTVDFEKEDEKLLIDTERGFTAQVEINTNMFQTTSAVFSDEKERFRRSGYKFINNYPFGGINVLDGTSVGFAYNSEWFGGTLSVNSGGLGGVRAWVSFFDSLLKISAGNDIGYGFADSQGAGAGLRVYDDRVRNVGEGGTENPTIDSNINPDDITQGKGILLEVDLEAKGIFPVKVALSSSGNPIDMSKNHGNFQLIGTGTYTAEPVYGRNLQYGANIGTKIGDYVKLNGSYIYVHSTNETEFQHISSVNKIVPRRADTEITNHIFGAFASAYPFGNESLGITFGYAGIFVQYLKEFSYSPATESGFVTVMPEIFKQGLNFSARYKISDLTVKTDHNYSFWSDKNYRVFNLHSPDVFLIDHGLRSADTAAADIAEVNHSFLWNGIGVSYNFTPVIECELYVRNLLRIDETPQFKMQNNYFSVELKSTFRFNPTVEAWTGITYQYTWRSANQELNDRVNEFTPGFSPKDITDTLSMIKIPIGFRVKLQSYQ